MTRRAVDIEDRLANPPQTDKPAQIRNLLDRLAAQDGLISSLAPEQWRSIASRVPPGHREEREALMALARLADQLRS